MIVDILFCFLLQTVFTVGIIVFFGFLTALCNRRFYANFGSYGQAVCYITGVIGTPVHELAHALMCIVFGHKILEIKLFQINAADGTLGYVSHTYDKKNIYQKIGNFFIGIAPIIVISALMYFLAWLLMPGFVQEIGGHMDANGIVNDFRTVFVGLWQVLCAFFSYAVLWQWWVFVLAGMFLAPHMVLSGADIKNAKGGILFLLVAVLSVDAVLSLIDAGLLKSFTGIIMTVASYLLCFLVLAMLLSLLAVAVSYLFRFIKRASR